MAWATASKSNGSEPMTAEADRSWQRPDAATLKQRARRGLKAIRDRACAAFALARRAPALPPRLLQPDAAHRRAQSDRARHPRLGHPLSQPVPRRADRRQGAEPAHARRDHRPRHRRLGRRRHRRSPTRPGEAARERTGPSGGAADDALPNSLEFTIDPERAAPILRRWSSRPEAAPASTTATAR